MPGFLGGSGGSSGGTGGEIRFPKEFIDPVTKLRVSEPENLIDTDFEYGLQPTKWETVELINNTPSFFSKSGDTTIPGILAITTNAGTREITVTTGLEHGLAVGIPINVQGSKSVTANGSYIINSIPDAKRFTYFCRDIQEGTTSIEDLYTSIVTGEFFQGSQVRIADAAGIVTDAASPSNLTVTTESPHGFGPQTPFYFLNLNSTISQEFESANTAAKSFDSSNSDIAQTFDGSNSLSRVNMDWSNSATVGGTVSTVVSVQFDTDTIRVSHTAAENFLGLRLGQPLYYSVVASSGYFLDNPQGVVFLKTITELGANFSTFQVSVDPDGPLIDLQSNMSGTFQIANQAKTFAGNNVNPDTQVLINVVRGNAIAFEGANNQAIGINGISTVDRFSAGLITVTTAPGAGLEYYQGAMVRYSTTGTAAAGLVNNTTYFVDSFTPADEGAFAFRVKNLPDDATTIAVSGGTGTQTFTRIGVSIDKDIVHIRNSFFAVKDMLEYSSPVGGAFGADQQKLFYFVSRAFDSHNYLLNSTSDLFIPTVATGGTILPTYQSEGRSWRAHQFTNVGSNTFTVQQAGSDPVESLVVAGGGAGGANHGGGGGAGGLRTGVFTPTATAHTVLVGAGGQPHPLPGTATSAFNDGSLSSIFGLSSSGGGGGGHRNDVSNISPGRSGGSGGGGGGSQLAFPGNFAPGAGTSGQGFAGGTGTEARGAGGGGAAAVGAPGGPADTRVGGRGRPSAITGALTYYSGGGGGSFGTLPTAQGGLGGGGASAAAGGSQPAAGSPGRGGGGGGGPGGGGQGASGGSGIVVVRYPLTPSVEFVPAIATGGTTTTVTEGNITYRVHSFTTVGTSNFVVQNSGSWNDFECLLVGGGGASNQYSGGGGGGEVVVIPRMPISVGTYPVVVGAGGVGLANNQYNASLDGQQTTFNNQFAKPGGGGKGSDNTFPPNNGIYATVANGGGGSSRSSGYFGTLGNFNNGITGIRFGGNRGGQLGPEQNSPNFPSGGGAGAGASVNFTTDTIQASPGGAGAPSAITGTTLFWGGGGGGQTYYNNASPSIGGNGGIGGGGAGSGRGLGAVGGGSALNAGGSTTGSSAGGNGGANTGGGGGGGAGESVSRGGNGGSGIVIIRYPIAVV